MAQKRKRPAVQQRGTKLSEYLQGAVSRAGRVSDLAREEPEVWRAMMEFAHYLDAGKATVSIAQFYEEFLVPLGCKVSLSTVREHIRRHRGKSKPQS